MEQKKETKAKAKAKSKQQFDIHAIEKKWQEYWKKEQIYEFDFKSRKIKKIKGIEKIEKIIEIYVMLIEQGMKQIN